MFSVRHHGIKVGVQSPKSRKSISFYAGNLHQATHRVASQPEVMFQTYFGSIFYLLGSTSEELICGSCRHRTSRPHFTLATHLCTRNRCVLLNHSSYKTGSSQRTNNLFVRKLMLGVQMVQHRRHNTARTASGSSNNQASGSILFRHSKSIRLHKTTTTQRRLVTSRLGVVTHRLASETQASGKNTLLIKPLFHRLLHHPQHLHKIIPNIMSLKLLNIFPKRQSVLVQVVQNIRKVTMRINSLYIQALITPFLNNLSSSYRIESSFTNAFTARIKSLKAHCIRVKVQKRIRFPNYLGTFSSQHIKNGTVGQVSLSRCSQRAIKGDFKRRCLSKELQEQFRSLSRSHGVRT